MHKIELFNIFTLFFESQEKFSMYLPVSKNTTDYTHNQSIQDYKDTKMMQQSFTIIRSNMA